MLTMLTVAEFLRRLAQHFPPSDDVVNSDDGTQYTNNISLTPDGELQIRVCVFSAEGFNHQTEVIYHRVHPDTALTDDLIQKIVNSYKVQQVRKRLHRGRASTEAEMVSDAVTKAYVDAQTKNPAIREKLERMRDGRS